MSTDPLLSAEDMIRLYIDRWSLEVTFEEVRGHLGVETQRQWSDKAIARSTPVLMGLYSLVCLMACKLEKESAIAPEKTDWHQREHIIFSDMLRTIRLLIWKEKLILWKAFFRPSQENITPETEDWIMSIVKTVLLVA